jgi:hypothetical protein
MEQGEHTMTVMEDKVEELDQRQRKILRKYERNMKDFWETIKRPNL